MSRNLEYGRVYTSRIQKPHFSGLGVYDPNKVFFREDPNGKVYVDDKLVKIVKTKDESNLIMIGDKLYKFVTIGDQVWLAENLDMPFAGASYYNGDPAQSYGLLYRGQDMSALNDYLLENNVGWHVPTIAEFESLAATAGGSSVAGGELKSTTSWNTNNGTDSLGFDGKAGGIYVGGSYSYKGSYGVFWTCVPGDSSKQNRFVLQDANAGVYINGLADSCGVNVRLIKDTDPVTIGGKTYKTAKIGDQIWTIENLELPFANATYYNNDPAQSYGLLYRGKDMGDLNDYLLDNNVGWHVPTMDELNILISTAGGQSVAGTHLKSTTSWNSDNSDNSTRFYLKAAGLKVGNTYNYKGTDTSLWSCVLLPDSSTAGRMPVDANPGAYTTTLNWNYGASVRLTKDTDPVTVGGKTYKTAKIGDRIWTIENLDYKIPGIAYNVTTIPEEPACWNYNNGDVPLKPRGGMYYNAYAAKYINDNNLIPGWHVPYAGEMEELCTLANNKAIKLRNFTGWENVTGGLESNSTNDFRFNAIPAGNRNTSNPPIFVNQDSYALIYTCTIEGVNAYRLNLNRSDNLTFTATTSKNGLSLRLVKDTEPVEIGGRKYKTQKIGNQLWMTENLDYIFEGLNVGGATLQSDVHAWYFNNDPEQSEGLLYNGYAAKYLDEHPELLPEGWRVPKSSDFGKLQVAVGGANTAGGKLKNPGTMNGTNYYGFNGLATGMIRSTGQFTDRNTYLRLWTPDISQTDETAQQFLTLESDKNTATIVSFPNDKTVAYSIRLVKDLTTSDSKGLLSTVVEDKGKEDIDEKPVEEEKKTEEIIVEKEIVKDETTENKR